MPKIILNEEDNTSAIPNSSSLINTVVVLGAVNKNNIDAYNAAADWNGIYECNNITAFKTNVGCVGAKFTASDESGTYYSYGNQIAYELITMGYNVLYVNIGTDYDEITASSKKTDLLAPLADKSNYVFRFIINGFKNGLVKEFNTLITQLTTKRGDCSSIIDLDEDNYSNKKSETELVKAISSELAKQTTADTYSKIMFPSFCYKGVVSSREPEYGDNLSFPASMHYLACFNTMLKNNYAEHYAPAGKNRGVSDYVIDSTTVKVGQILTNILQPRTISGTTSDDTINKACNVIKFERGKYYLVGNRTAALLNANNLKATHYANIRELVTTIKHAAYTTLSAHQFDQNSANLWLEICSELKPLLDDKKANEGIYDYRFEQIATKEKGKIKGLIRIVPIEAVEDFEITISLEDDITISDGTVSN